MQVREAEKITYIEPRGLKATTVAYPWLAWSKVWVAAANAGPGTPYDS